jgi:hypothetical protein
MTEHPGLDRNGRPNPVPNDGPSAHDMVIKDLLSRDLRWDMSYGSARHLRDHVTEGLRQRKELGVKRYGTPLQPDNGRDSLRDLHEELMDATVYCRNRMLEDDADTLEWAWLAEIYEDLVTHLVKVQRLREAAYGPAWADD